MFARPATSCCFYRQGNRWRDRERESWWIRSMEVKNETEREVSFTGFSTTACPRAEDACLRAQKLVDKEHVAQDVENLKSRWELMPSRQITTTFSLLSFHCDGFKRKKKRNVYYPISYYSFVRSLCYCATSVARMGSRDSCSRITVRKHEE